MPSVFGPNREPGPKWQPKFPGFARQPNQGTQREGELAPLQTGESDGTMEWVDAPADSHVHSFRLYSTDDARVRRFLNRFLGGESSVQIRFKPSPGRPQITEYHYFFATAKEAESVFEQLVMASHPGEVVHRSLIQAGVRYKRVS